jgi:RimJ/RimL family protein N-acetyltransferase
MIYDFETEALRDTGSVVLKTERLTLRRPLSSDAKAIARLANDRRIAENLRRLPHPYSRTDAEAFLRALAAERREEVFLIEADGAPAGMIGLDFGIDEGPEIGYWLGVAHWGKGFATEAARAVIDYAFEEFPVDELFAGARVTNPASRRVLEKCGFQWTGVGLYRFVALGSSTPVDRFKLNRGIWQALKAWGQTHARRLS